VQLVADLGEDPGFGQVGGCVVARDGEGVVADGVEEYPIADFTGEAEEGGELLVTLGAMCVGTSSESIGRECLTCEAVDWTSGGGERAAGYARCCVCVLVTVLSLLVGAVNWTSGGGVRVD
jgi:hypothetical protein